MAIEIGIGLSTEKDPLRAAQSAIRDAKAGIYAQKISLAFVFSSPEFARPEVLQLIGDVSGAGAVVGASTLAVISDKGIFRHAVAVMLVSLPENIYFNAGCVKGLGPQTVSEGAEQLGEKLLYGIKNARRDFAMLFSDALMYDGARLLDGLQKRLGISFPLAGACASDELSFQKTCIYFNNEILSGAACGVLWGGKLNFGIGTKHGWKAIGKPRTVTRSEGNTVYEIDGDPAVNIYKEYFGYGLDKLKKELKRISILYPIGIYLSAEEEYLLRNMLYIEENGSVIFQGGVAQGSQIKLMIGTEESCLRATEHALTEALRGLAGKPASFVFIFDSASRYTLLGRRAAEEINIIKASLPKDTPMIGLYTYGEQAPLKNIGYQGRAYFHNQTVTVLAVGG